MRGSALVKGAVGIQRRARGAGCRKSAGTASEPSKNTLKGSKYFHLKDKARIWPRMSDMFRVCSTAFCKASLDAPSGCWRAGNLARDHQLSERDQFAFIGTLICTGARRNLAICGTIRKTVCSTSEGWWEVPLLSHRMYQLSFF